MECPQSIKQSRGKTTITNFLITTTMKELSKFELATVKRTAKSVKMQRDKKAKLEEKIAGLQQELDTVNSIIDSFEEPIKKMTGGFTSEEVLNGTYDKVRTGGVNLPSADVTEAPEMDADPVGDEMPINE